ncbi:MAG: hypothetical protein JWO32_437 [Bacteroidetes bacterium]|nr:hypothetical protein [Bacteroidota bacterium]
MTKYIKIIIVFILICGPTKSQTCEKYNRKLFHSLPDIFPDSINCKDKAGKKQGWWIYYKVLYNPVDKPDELDKGDYVPDYIYGQYKNDAKIGDWHTVKNVHLIYDQRVDKYYYSKDTVRVISEFASGGWFETEILYINDSTIIKSTILRPKDEHKIFFECFKKGDICIMTYQKDLIKTFPFADFEIEFEKALYWTPKQK